MISLADAERRRTAFHEAAASSNLPWSFWDAHRQLGAPLSYDAGRAAKDLGRSLTEAERGCYSSHYSLWRWLLESPFEQMIVLEDDVVADWRLLEALTRIRFEGLGIEYLKLFGKVPASWRYIKSPFLGWYHHLIRFTGFPLGTQAYLMSRNAAAKMFVAGRSVEAPIDVYMDQSWRHGVLNLALYPFPVFECHQPSSIGEERLRYQAASGGEALLQRARRQLRRKLRLAWSVYGPEPPEARRLKRTLRRAAVGLTCFENAK